MDKLDLIINKIEDLKDFNSKEHKGIMRRQDVTNGNVKKNTEFRIASSTTVRNLKWLIGILGIGNIINIIYLLTK